MMITFPAAVQSLLWSNFRLPMGATLCISCLLIGSWIARIFAYHRGDFSRHRVPDAWGYLWFTRDRNLDAITPKEEITRYFTLTMWISIYTFAVYWAGSYFAEQDNSWHQVSIRDTPFTANHIIEFYFNFPFYVLMGGSAWLYARTRLPLYAKGISLPLTLAVVGPFMIFVSVGFNEWGHTFWFREEFFAAPIHWGFVTGVWFALGVGGILLQQVSRLIQLLDQIEDAA